MFRYYLQMHDFRRSRAVVTDQDGSVLYHVKPAFSLLGRTMAVVDGDRQIVARVRQAISPITPKFCVAITGQAPFSVQRQFSLKDAYSIKGRPWSIVGEAPGAQYHVIQADGGSLWKIQKNWEVKSEQYLICAPSREDALTGIGITLAIVASKQALRR